MCPETNVSETRAFDSKPLSQVCLRYRKVSVKGSVSASLNTALSSNPSQVLANTPNKCFRIWRKSSFMALALYANVNAVTNNATHESL